jgi:hypothetical protein
MPLRPDKGMQLTSYSCKQTVSAADAVCTSDLYFINLSHGLCVNCYAFFLFKSTGIFVCHSISCCCYFFPRLTSILALLSSFILFLHLCCYYLRSFSLHDAFFSRIGVRVPIGARFSPLHVFRMVLWPTHSPIQYVLWDLSLGVKRPERKADHSPPTSAEVENKWIYIYPFPDTSMWRCA